jgi:hypothetical protein
MASSYTVSWAGLWGGPEVGETIEITYVCTAHTDGTTTAISTDSDTIADERTYTQLIRGRRFRAIEAFPTSGGEAPDDDVNVTVKDSDGLDLLNGNGTNLVHSTDKKIAYAETDGVPAEIPVRGALTIAIADSGAAADEVTLRLIFT